MHVNLLNILLGTPAAANSSILGEGGGGPDVFAQLLGGEADFTPGQQGKGSAAGNPLLTELTPSALVAQEVGFTHARALLEQPITPEDAAYLITRINDLLAQGQGNTEQQHSWEQLKEALEPVAEGAEPVELAEILDQVPDLPLPTETADAENHSTSLMRMLAWVQQALDKKREIAAQPADTPEQAALAAFGNGLQAIMFRTDDRAPQASPAASEEEAKVIATAVPSATPPVTSSTTDAPVVPSLPELLGHASAKKPLPEQAAHTVIDVTASSRPAEVVPEWVQAMMQGKKSTSLDTVIPPLALEGDDALPAVTLPQVGSDAFAEADADVPVTAEKVPPTPTREIDWLKRLPFPLAVSEATAEETSQDIAALPALEPLPDTTSAKDSAKDIATAKVTLPEVAQGDVYADDSARPLSITVAPPSAYTRHAQVQPTAWAHHPLVPASPSDQVQVAIRNATAEGIDRITIQLDPADLGRVEVRMEVGEQGRTHMVFTADKASTLDALSRGAYGLERSLADAGIKADAGTMEFNLRQQPQFVQADAGQHGHSQGQHASAERDEQNTPHAPIASVAAEEAAPAAIQQLMLKVSAGVDIEA